jgi:hypothetical protein
MVDLDLCTWGDGGIRLVFWDYLQGQDQVFVLHADGTATQETEGETETSVNLVLALRELLTKQLSRMQANDNH